MLEEDGELDRILSGRGLTFDNPPAPHVEPPKPVVIPPRTTLGDSAQSTIFPPGVVAARGNIGPMDSSAAITETRRRCALPSSLCFSSRTA
jgi:hypothetical protein